MNVPRSTARHICSGSQGRNTVAAVVWAWDSSPQIARFLSIILENDIISAFSCRHTKSLAGVMTYKAFSVFFADYIIPQRGYCKTVDFTVKFPEQQSLALLYGAFCRHYQCRIPSERLSAPMFWNTDTAVQVTSDIRDLKHRESLRRSPF